jgi:hypothetical protein
MSAPLWMIAWVMLATGQTGHGQCSIDRGELENLVVQANEFYAGRYIHRVVPCEDSAT